MNYLQSGMALLVASCFAVPTWAATVIQNKDMQGNNEIVTITETKALIENPTYQDHYTVIDLDKQEIYAVNKKRQWIVVTKINDEIAPLPDMPMPPQQAMQQSAPEPQVVKSELKEISVGPNIAGYETTYYQVLADSTVCSNEFLSADALNIAHLKKFRDTMDAITTARMQKMKAQMAARMQKMVGGQTPPKGHPCMQAMETVKADYLAKGISLKTANNQGQAIREVVSILTDVDVTDDKFALPAGFILLTEQEATDKMRQEMEQWMSDPKNKQQFFQNMQQRMQPHQGGMNGMGMQGQQPTMPFPPMPQNNR